MWGLREGCDGGMVACVLQMGLYGCPSCIHHGGGPYAMVAGMVMAPRQL